MADADQQVESAQPIDGDSSVEWAAKHYLAAKAQAKHIVNYNGANLAYLHAADMANRLGLDDSQKARITPFPAPTNVIVTSGAQEPSQAPQEPVQQATAPQATPLSSYGKLAAAALIGAGVVPASYGAWQWFTPSPEPPAAIEQPVQEPQSGEMGYKVY